MSARETVRSSLRLLEGRDRRLLAVAAAVQMLTAVLDLLGVAMIGLAGVLLVSAVSSQSPPGFVATLTRVGGLDRYPDTALALTLLTVAGVLLIAKSVLAPLLMARVFRFLARCEASVSARLSRALLSRPLTFVQSRSTQQTSVALIRGVSAATITVLGQAVVIASESAVLALLAAALLVINPPVAIGAIAFLAGVSWGLQQAVGVKSARYGAQRSDADTDSLRTVQEAIGAYRELTVSSRRSLYADRLQALRYQAAVPTAGTQLIGLLPKYVSEAALVVGAFVLAGVLFSTQPAPVAAGSFALFLASASRVMPALLRIQTSTLAIRAASGPAGRTYALAADLWPLPASSSATGAGTEADVARSGFPDFQPGVRLAEVTFTYPGASSPAVSGINLTVPAGRSVAVVGRSGAGKSTLADLLLGVLSPDSGEIAVGGLSPFEAVGRWPGAIAYVPQEVMLVEDSVRANVALGLPAERIDDQLVWEALGRAGLSGFVRCRPEGLSTLIGERGQRLSGGQRQRLGIARALYSRPRLLVLDEATSAMDAETEQAVTAALRGLDGVVTVIVIAHRLSTVRNVDQVVYLENGRCLAAGTFSEVRSRVPALRRQADLMGLRLV
jgi:ATP-binding cassette, subfamily B, bacterial PglK